MQVASIRGVQRAASVVLRIGIVIRHAFTAAIVVRAINLAGNRLRAARMSTIFIRRSLVLRQKRFPRLLRTPLPGRACGGHKYYARK